MKILKSRDSQWDSGWFRSLSLIAIPLYLYLNLFLFPNTSFFLMGDQNFFWVDAMRLLQGERVYQDFFQFTPPGTDFFYLALFRLFGAHLWVANFAVFILGVALCWICLRLAQRLMERDLAVLASLFFLVFIYGDRLDATHHWFSLFAGLCAISVVLPERTLPRIAIAGLLLGVASFFTQTTGVAGVAALIAALAWEHYSSNRTPRSTLTRQLLLCLTFALAWGVLSAPLILHVGWRQLWYLQITYPLHYVVFEYPLLPPNFAQQLSLHLLLVYVERELIYLLLLVIYPAVLYYSWKRRREMASQDAVQLVIISLFGLSLLLVIITRLNWNRLYAASMPAIILLLWAVGRLDKRRRYATTAIWAAIAFVALRQTWSSQHSPHRIKLLPAGKVAVAPLLDEKFSWLKEHTSPGDLFFQGQGVYLYFPFHLSSPAFVDYLWTGEVTRPEYVDLTIKQFEHQPLKYIFWSQDLLTRSEPYRYGQNHLGPFHVFLTTHYKRVQVFSDGDEVWERR